MSKDRHSGVSATSIKIINSPYPTPLLRALIVGCSSETACEPPDARTLELPLSVKQVDGVVDGEQCHAIMEQWWMGNKAAPHARYNLSFVIMILNRPAQDMTRWLHVRLEYASERAALKNPNGEGKPFDIFRLTNIKSSSWVGLKALSPVGSALQMHPAEARCVSRVVGASACSMHDWRAPGQWVIPTVSAALPVCGPAKHAMPLSIWQGDCPNDRPPFAQAEMRSPSAFFSHFTSPEAMAVAARGCLRKAPLTILGSSQLRFVSQRLCCLGDVGLVFWDGALHTRTMRRLPTDFAHCHSECMEAALKEASTLERYPPIASASNDPRSACRQLTGTLC